MTTKLGNFKLGPAKTREVLTLLPLKVEILKLKANDHDWQCYVPKDVKNTLEGVLEDIDLLLSTNAEPERVEFVFEFPANIPAEPPLSWSQLFFQARYSLPGKRCKVTVEVLDE